MALRVSLSSGNIGDAGVFGTVTNTPTLHASTNVSLGATSYTDTFTAPNTTNACVGAIFCVTTIGSNTYTLTLQENLVDVASTTTSFDPRQMAQVGWIFVRFATPYVFTSTASGYYRFKTTRVVNVSACYVSTDSGGTLPSFLAVDNRTTAIASTDDIWIMGENLVTNPHVITVTGTTQLVGSGADTSLASYRSLGNAIFVSMGGTLQWDTTANSTLTVKGNICAIGCNNSGTSNATIQMGTTSVAYPTGKTATLLFDQNGTSGNYGMRSYGGSQVTFNGQPKTYYKTHYSSGAGTVGSPLITADAVDWTVGDEIVIAPSSSNIYNFSETIKTKITVKNSSTSYVCQTDDQMQYANGNLETWTTATQPAIWTASPGTGGSVNREATIIHGGTYSAKIVRGTADGYIRARFQNAPNSTGMAYCTPGATYTLNIWTRGDGTAGSSARYRVYDATNSADIVATTSVSNDTTTWTQFTTTFNVPTSCVSLYIYVYNPTTNAKTCYVDDVSVTIDTLPAIYNSNSWILNTSRNAIIGSTDPTMSWYYYNSSSTSGGGFYMKWAKINSVGAALSNKTGFWLCANSLNAIPVCDYSVCNMSLAYGWYWVGFRALKTHTGLITIDHLPTSASYPAFNVGVSNTNLVDCFAVRTSTVGFLLTSMANGTFTRCYGIANSIQSSSYTTAYYCGIAITNLAVSTLTDCEIHCCRGSAVWLYGTGVGVTFNGFIEGTKGANQLGIYATDDVYSTYSFNSCYFNSSPYLTNYLNSIPGSQITFDTLNGGTYNNIWYTYGGSIQASGGALSDPTCHTAGGYALRFNPEDTTDGMTWSFTIPTGNIQNKTMVVGIWCYVNSANYWATLPYTMPYLQVNYDNGTLATAYAAQSAGSWMLLPIAFTPTTTYGQITVKLGGLTSATGSDSRFYFDDWVILYPAGYQLNLSGMDLWANGQPVIPPISTNLSALDVWSAPSTTDYGSTSFGNLNKKIDIQTDDNLALTLSKYQKT